MRKLLMTTALVALVSNPVFAETKPAKTDSNGEVLYMFDVKTLGATSTRGYLASNLIGKYIYVSATEDSDTIGDVNDIVVGEAGAVKAVIVGVGGFLGIGEKDVAIEFDRLSMVSKGEGEFRIVSTVSKQELEGAEAYERPSYITATVDSAEKTMKKWVAKDQITDREAFRADKTIVEFGAIRADELMDADVYDSTGNHVGEIGDVLLTADGKIDAALIDVGGFLGIGEKQVAVSFDNVEILKDEDGEFSVTTSYSEEQLEQAKAYDAATWENNRDTMRLMPRG